VCINIAKPIISSTQAAALPSLNALNFWNAGSTTKISDELMKPHFPLSLTAAVPSLKSLAASYLNDTATLPVESTNPTLSWDATRKKESGEPRALLSRMHASKQQACMHMNSPEVIMMILERDDRRKWR